MISRSMTMLSLAVVCGLGAMYGTNRLMGKDRGRTVELQDVIVAARDLKIEEVIKPDLVKVVRMEKTSVPPGAFSQLKDVEGRWVQIGLLEGESVVDKKLAERGSPPGLVSKIARGMRAVTLDVNEQSGVSGFVMPDHRVDVIQVDQSGGAGSFEGATVLQDVLVLASGQTFTRQDDRSIQSRTVTLSVTPEQAKLLIAAKARGPISLVLRGLNDHAQTDNKPKDVPAPKAEPPAPVFVRPVEVVAAAPPPPPPVPPPAPAPPAPKPERVVVVYKGVDKVSRIKINPGDDAPADGSGVADAPTRN